MTDIIRSFIEKMDDYSLTMSIANHEAHPDAPTEIPLPLLRTEQARRNYEIVLTCWRFMQGQLATATEKFIAAMIYEKFPLARTVVTEGFPADEIGGNDGLALVAITDADGRVLADRGTPDERFDELTDGLHEHLGTLIDLNPELFDQQHWSLP